MAEERILGRIPIVDHHAGAPERGAGQSGVPEHGGRAEVDDVDPLGHCGHHAAPLGVGPGLVVTEGQDGVVVGHQARVHGQLDIADVAHVEPLRLHEAHQWVLVREEVGRTVAAVEGSIERCHPSAVAHRIRRGTRPKALIEGVATEGVPARLGQGSADGQIGRVAGGDGEGQWDVGLLVGRTDELEQVVPGDEGLGEADGEAGLPVRTAGHVDPGREAAGGLSDGHGRLRLPDKSSPRALVVAHAEGLEPEARRRRGDVEGHRLPRCGIGRVGEPFDHPSGRGARDLPGGGAGPGVLRHHGPRDHAIGAEAGRRRCRAMGGRTADADEHGEESDEQAEHRGNTEDGRPRSGVPVGCHGVTCSDRGAGSSVRDPSPPGEKPW